jgi:hypothetical protein
MLQRRGAQDERKRRRRSMGRGMRRRKRKSGRRTMRQKDVCRLTYIVLQITHLPCFG